MSRTARSVFTEGNPNKLPTAAQSARLGEGLALIPRTFRGTVVSNVLVLPNEAKAVIVLQCFVSAGTVNGYFSPSYDPDGVPATTTAAVNPAGNISFLAADAVTEAEVVYVPREGVIQEDIIPVTSNVGTFLQGRKSAQLLEVEALVGTSLGLKSLTAATSVRGSTPAAGAACINLLGTGVQFAAGDAVTKCRVKYIAQPGVGTGTPRGFGVELDATDKNY